MAEPKAPEQGQSTAPLEAVQQGSRWLFQQPDEDAVKAWFDGQHLHTGMHHEPYYGGVVLIGATEKFKRTYVNASGAWFVKEEERTVYTPYVKVDTRVAYFWALVDVMNAAVDETRFYGVIEPVPAKVVSNDKSAYYNEHLPEGYFIHVAAGSNPSDIQRFICAQWRVAIYERESYLRWLDHKSSSRSHVKVHIPAVLQGIGTKQTSMNKKYADENALMKAETGAIGRALGVAGILVVGTGIATAEDMQEALAYQNVPTVNREGQTVDNNAALPAVIGPQEATPGTPMEGPDVGPVTVEQKSPQDVDQELRERATTLSIELKKFPEPWEAYLHWYNDERGFPSITELSGPALRGAVVKLERALDAAKNGPAPTGDAAAPPQQ